MTTFFCFFLLLPLNLSPFHPRESQFSNTEPRTTAPSSSGPPPSLPNPSIPLPQHYHPPQSKRHRSKYRQPDTIILHSLHAPSSQPARFKAKQSKAKRFPSRLYFTDSMINKELQEQGNARARDCARIQGPGLTRGSLDVSKGCWGGG